MSVLQVGDSLSNGYSPVVGNVPAMPWGNWIAFANGWSFTRHSKTGRTSTEILDELAPRIDAQYSLGCLTAGANDIARKNWDEKETAASIHHLWSIMAMHCDYVLGLRLPNWYFSMTGVPARISARTGVVNRILEDVSNDSNSVLISVDDLTGPRYVRPDQVHFTSVGELTIASRATRRLEQWGLNVVDPVSLGLGKPEGYVDPLTRVRFGYGAVRQGVRQTAKTAIKRW